MHYAIACETLSDFAARHGVPVAETQAGKGALAWDHPCAVGAIGVTGGSAANELAAEADLILGLVRGFPISPPLRAACSGSVGAAIRLNAAGFDAAKHGALPLVADARAGLKALEGALVAWAAPVGWTAKARDLAAKWNATVAQATAPSNAALPSDAQCSAR